MAVKPNNTDNNPWVIRTNTGKVVEKFGNFTAAFREWNKPQNTILRNSGLYSLNRA